MYILIYVILIYVYFLIIYVYYLFMDISFYYFSNHSYICVHNSMDYIELTKFYNNCIIN